jgi:hypothetical protein
LSSVFLVDPLVAIGSVKLYLEINRLLQGHFDKVSARMKPPSRIVVAFIPAVPSPTPFDLLIYFVPTEISIVSQFAGRSRNPLLDDGDGFTSIKTATANGVTTASAASEVYTKTLSAKVLAALAFHEGMHNRLAVGQALHGKNGMAQATVDDSTIVTDENANDMAAAFRTRVTQWPDGVAPLAARRVRRDNGDPLWYL